MTAVAPAASTPARVKAPPVHEMRASLEAMTPQTRQVIEELGTDALAFQLGMGSLAGALNDSIRYRISGDGPMGSRELVPDSPAAHAVDQSRAGEKLVRQLRTALASIDGHEQGQQLQYLVLAKDTDGAIANSWLGRAASGDFAGQLRMQTMSGKMPDGLFGPPLREEIRTTREKVGGDFALGLGAWNQGTMAIIGPEVARNMLTGAGAYKPSPTDLPSIAKAGWGAQVVNHLPTHEMQHSATPPSDELAASPAKWLEEATAEVLSLTPAVLARTANATGVSRHSYAGHMAHEPAVELGWKPWNPKVPGGNQATAVAGDYDRNYARADDVLRELLASAGFDLDTQAAADRTATFLQQESVEHLPAKLADVLASKWKIDASRTAELAGRIATVIDDIGGVGALKSDFGIG